MGFYIRKSIKAGPFRFNLSKSGLGVSVGIPGIRIGSGPRGNYIHMGCGGLYYRKTLNSQQELSPKPASNDLQLQLERALREGGHDGFKEIDSGDVSAMEDSSSAELLAEFDAKRKKLRLWPFTIAATLFVLYIAPPSIPVWGMWLVLGLGATSVIAAYVYDQVRKSIVLFYEMEAEYEAAYVRLNEAFEGLRKVRRSWHIEAKANVLDKKRNSGAELFLKRKDTDLAVKSPPYVKTNIPVPSIPVGRQTLFFFPDRLLVFEKNKVGAVSYDDLDIHIAATRFIEENSVPGDAQIVDHTWRYVNKSGGPDKRFNDNRQIPVCLYENMHLTSITGLNELIQFSKCNVSITFKQALESLSATLSGRKPNATFSILL